MVMDYMAHDLRGLLDSGAPLDITHVMCLAQQLLRGTS